MATTLTTKSGGRFETNLLIPLSGHVVRNPLSFTKEGFLGGFFYQISPNFVVAISHFLRTTATNPGKTKDNLSKTHETSFSS